MTTEKKEPDTSDAALEVQALDVVFGKHHVLKQVSLTVPAGRTLGLVGESGSVRMSRLALKMAM